MKRDQRSIERDVHIVQMGGPMCISKIHIMNKVHKFESATSLSIYLNRDGSKKYLQKWLT